MRALERGDRPTAIANRFEVSRVWVYEWQAAQPALDIMKLVFLDETEASTNRARRYGRAAHGASPPCLTDSGTPPPSSPGYVMMTSPPPMVADGAMTGALFLKYVQEFLCPTLHPGDIVIADN